MSRTVRTVSLFLSGFVLLSFGVVVVNQTAQIVQLAGHVHPALGTVTFGTLVVAYVGFLGVPIVLYLRLPSPLVPPEEAEGPAFEAHLERLGGRLAKNPHLLGYDLSGREKIEAALAVLSQRTDEIVRESASSVFLSTAVSQSGRLDGLLVLAVQSRMVWKIAHVYHQRPTLREMTHLYANVAGTAFVAGELQDLDMSEQVEPVLSAAVGALGASVPGLQVAGTILANCVLSGSANAFLTLRVGMIAKRYSAALTAERKATLRRAATAEAARLLGAVVAEGTARISKAMWRVSVGKVSGAVSGVTDYARGAGAKLMAKVRTPRPKEPQPEVS